MSEAGREIRKQLKVMESAAETTELLRADAKKDSGRLTQFGRDLLAAGKKNGIPPSRMARLLDITPAAVTPYYK